MTTHPQTHPLSELVACAVCRKEVPRSEAVDFEVGDYVAHFCGLECYAQWKGRDTGAVSAEGGSEQG
jgi:hypothetical protein